MLLSKSNLAARQLASKDEFDRGLNGLRVEEDGATVGGNRRSMMIVSPVERPVPTPRGIEPIGVGVGGAIMELSHAEKIEKNMPRDKRHELQHVAIVEGRDPRKLAVATWSRADHTTIERPAKQGAPYPDWRVAVRRVAESEEDEGAGRVCVNRKELIEALKALGDACPDKGDWGPVWLQMGRGGSGLLLRGQNYLTNQTAMAILLPHERVGGWLKWSDWERRIWDGAKKAVKKVLKKTKRRER